MRCTLRALFLSIVLIGTPVPARAQAPPSGPLILHLAPSARTAALGSAWVAGRDHDVIFYNPAQLIGARAGLDLSLARHGQTGRSGSIASTYAAGKMSLTLGWGVQFVDARVVQGTPYPFTTETLFASDGGTDVFSTVVAVGGAVVFKGFRVGASGKYATDHASVSPLGPQGAPVPMAHGLLADVGVARNVLGGVAAFSVQNLGGGVSDDEDEPVRLAIPRQYRYGWSMSRQAGPLDLGIFTQVTQRDEWASPAAGLEVGYTWIDGYTVVLRAGASRPETREQQPVALGAGLTVDRVTIDYAIQFFEGGRSSNGVTIRWR